MDSHAIVRFRSLTGEDGWLNVTARGAGSSNRAEQAGQGSEQMSGMEERQIQLGKKSGSKEVGWFPINLKITFMSVVIVLASFRSAC